MQAKPLLFLPSYSPLFALLAIRFEPRTLWVPCAALAVAGLVSSRLLLHLDSRVGASPHTLTSARDAGPEAASYLRAICYDS